jgi:hypothetical protein
MTQSNPRDRKLIRRTYQLGEGSVLLHELRTLCDDHPDARLYYQPGYYEDEPTSVYLEWHVPETDAAWAARLVKLDARAQKRAQQASERRAREAIRLAEQETQERALYEKLRAKFES